MLVAARVGIGTTDTTTNTDANIAKIEKIANTAFKSIFFFITWVTEINIMVWLVY